MTIVTVVYVLRLPASKAVLNDSESSRRVPSLYGFSAE